MIVIGFDCNSSLRNFKPLNAFLYTVDIRLPDKTSSSKMILP